MELQTDLSKFYRPITITQKATAREITEGLKPIREGIEKLSQAIQPIGEATGEAPEEEEEEMIGEIAKKYLNRPSRDTTFGICEKQGLYYIGDKQAIIFRNNIIIQNEKFDGTHDLWELMTSKTPQMPTNKKDYDNYVKLLLMLFITIMIQTTPTQEAVRVINGKKYLVLFGIIVKSMRERGSLLFRVILTRC